MNQEELEQKIVKLEAEIASLKDVKKARTALAWAGMASTTWRHSIIQKTSAICNYVAVLRRSLKTGANLTNMELVLEEIYNLAESLGEYSVSPPLLSKEGVELVPINTFLQEMIEQIQRTLSFSDIQISLQFVADEPLLVRANIDWLEKGLNLLLVNSAEAMASSISKRLTIRTSISNNQVRIFIEDTGRGVPDNAKPLLFIQPIRKEKGEKGSGIGLLMAQMIFQSFGGGVTLEKTNAKGSIFSIYLPRVEQ